MINDKWNYNNINNIVLKKNYSNKQLSFILNDLIKIKNDNDNVFLTLCDWSYPVFKGGGELWLFDLSKKMIEFGYNSIIITFIDKNYEFYKKFNIIESQGVKIIQMINDSVDIIKFIKFLNPKCISHQGLNRVKYMKISNVLNIPFISGFCFWNDIIHFKKSYENINILNNKNIKISKKFKLINKNSDFLYCASEFMNDVIYKYHKIKLPVIETISLKNTMIERPKNTKYITMINIHYYKGGWMLYDLLNNLNIDCPFVLIDSEKNDDKFYETLEKIIEKRNNKFHNKTILIKNKIENIDEIYKKTKILLIGSLVDETFCRVAYEGMMNKIPILSTKKGNLKYLLNNYADFLEEKTEIWVNHIKNIYNDEQYLNEMKNRNNKSELNENYIFENFHNIIKNIKLKNKRLIEKKNIGLLIPWADQGLGIQGREYYIELTKNNYNVHVFSYKPYHSTKKNKLLQTNENEWKYKNIHYFDEIRENITLENIIDFVISTNISTIIIPEICFEHIFIITSIFKLLNIKCIAIPNIEIVRYDELFKFDIFDVVLCNNLSSFNLLKKIGIDTKLDLLGFYLNHPFIQYKKISKKKNIQFYCCGGFNSFIRKHIDRICDVFNLLHNYNVELYVYIQDDKIIKKIKKKYKNNIHFIFKNQSYYNILKMHRDHDIFIHMGSHEGLGLGFYESIQSGTPVITIDTTPNNEIIIHNVNGWLVKSKKYELKDNDKSIVYGDKFDKNDFKNTIINICKNVDFEKMFENTKEFNEILKNKNYIQNLIKYL